MEECRIADFFLGGNMPGGFCSYFDRVEEPREGAHRYLLKGGPGTGKSAIIKRLFRAAQEERLSGLLERIHCSLDGNSLDGFIWKEGGFSVFDATAPHTLEPQYPGVYDRVINLGDALNNHMLSAAFTPISVLSERIAALHERCRMLLSAQDMLYQQNQLVLSGYLQEEKLKRSAERFAYRLLQGCSGMAYEEQIRMLSGLTDGGIVLYDQTISRLADRIICIRDDFGLVSAEYMKAVLKQAEKHRLSVILCMSPFHRGRIDHIIFPKERIAIVTGDFFTVFSKSIPMQHIRISRYLPAQTLRMVRKSVQHRIKMMKILTDEAAGQLHQAKILHDKMEGYYTPAMDFSKADQMTEQIMTDLLKK